MKSNFLSKELKRSALAVALGMCFVSGVQAQSSVGSIFGDASANVPVAIENIDTGTSRQINSDASGHFTFSQLSPGRYRVTSGSVTREVQVKVGTGTQVSLAAAGGNGATTLDAVTVVGVSAINPIDVSSVESSTVFTQQQIQALPVGRDITNVALLAPGTVKGDPGFGNLASFGGSSVAENGYYINGFDVTNIFNFLSYAGLPFDAIAEQQVKTGGYGAEYGRSLGGVISLVTKRGTNEWKGGASVYWDPEFLRKHSANVLTRDTSLSSIGKKYYRYNSDDDSNSVSYNIYGGGPIIKDKLFVFGLIEGRKDTDNTFGETTSSHTSNTQPHGLVKLDWNITDSHIVELTAISNRDKVKTTTYRNPVDQYYTGEHGAEEFNYSTLTGGETYIGKYTGYFGDSFILSAQVGQLKSLVGDRDPALLGADMCSRAYDSRANPADTVYIGCYNEANPFVRDQTRSADFDKRNAWRIDGEWILGDHKIRFGYDAEKFVSRRAGTSYSGDGLYYRYFKRTEDFDTGLGAIIPAGTDYVRTWDFRNTSGDFEVLNDAVYLEDSWQVTDNVLLYLGARGESFENKNADGIAFAKSDTLWAPRLGFSWDAKGDSSVKVFGNAGRYYIPIAGNTSVRMAGGESTAINYYYYSGQIDPATGLPVGGLGERINPVFNAPNPVAPDPHSVAATNLSPMYQDEFILGAQVQINQNWMVGARGIYRDVKAGMDDICMHQPIQRWLEENGYPDAWWADSAYVGGPAPTCYMINPGKDVHLMVDPYGDGNLIEATVPASYFDLPAFGRKYQALEIFFERFKSDNWYLQGSYTYARSKGTSEGYVNSTLVQTDAGITQDFDFKPFTDGTYGYLPNDRRHTLKVFGVYEFSDEWSASGNLLIQSGSPKSCYGFIPLDDPSLNDSDVNNPVYDYYVANHWAGNSFYCKDASGNPVLGHRGDRGRTSWITTLDAGVAYRPNWGNKKLTFELKLFNMLNAQRVTKYNEFSELGSTNVEQYADPDYGNIVNYQAPRSGQFTVRYEF
jgi:hypothetical protein